MLAVADGLSNIDVVLSGYPMDPPLPADWTWPTQSWEENRSGSTNGSFVNVLLDATGGQSGGPVLSWDFIVGGAYGGLKPDVAVIGIFRAQHRDPIQPYNYGVRLTDGVLDWLGKAGL